MTEEIRIVQMGDTTVEVEVDPDDFKKPGLIWLALALLGLVWLAVGHVYIGLALLTCSLTLLVTLHFRRKAAMEIAIREAARQGYWGYHRSRMVAQRSLR